MMEKALDVIGNDAIVSNPRKRAADLGLRVDGHGKFNSFGDYMHSKVKKLLNQCNPDAVKSGIFNGLSFYVDGMTTPPAHEIRKLVVNHGGQYHHYYLHGRTTYQIAEVLANTKIERLRKDEIVLKPGFITDCIKENKLLPIEDYLVVKKKEAVTGAGMAVQQFFNRSRLHLISTMAAELKKFVADMKANESVHEQTSRKKLEHLRSRSEENGGEASARVICHIDMDCFFVSVALKTRPDLIGKPVAVTHSAASSGAYGEISSCSYEARSKGVYARELVKDALKTCPDLVCVPYQFEEYVKTAKQLYSIIARYTLKIKAVSCDELYFDLGSICTEMNISDPLSVISIIRNEILAETQCVASAGLGPNWLLARMATKKAKPRGQFYVTQDKAVEFLKEMPISDLPTIGWSSQDSIHGKFGDDVKTCGQLMDYSLEELRKVLGVTNGEKVYRALKGKCDEIDFNEVINQKSVSVNVNFGVRLKTEKELSDLLFGIASELAGRLRQVDKLGTHLTLKYLIRQPDAPLEPAKYGAHGHVFSLRKAGNLARPTGDEKLIHELALKLTKELKPEITDIRGVALHLNKLNSINGSSHDKAKNHGNGITLWDFMNVSVKPGIAQKTVDGKTPGFVWAPPPKEAIKKAKQINAGQSGEDNEWNMKISDVAKIVTHEYVKPRKLGKLPVKPKRGEKVTITDPKIVDTQTLNLGGTLINFKKPPVHEAFKMVIAHLKKCVLSMQIDVIFRMLSLLERHLQFRDGNKDWHPLIEKSKRYLNWYCYNHHRRKLYPLPTNAKTEDEQFQEFLDDVADEFEPAFKKPRTPSPELIFDGMVKATAAKSVQAVLDPDDDLIIEAVKKGSKANQVPQPKAGPSTTSSSKAPPKYPILNVAAWNDRKRNNKQPETVQNNKVEKGQQIIPFKKAPIKKKPREIECVTLDDTLKL